MRLRNIQEIQLANRTITGAFIACFFGPHVFLIARAYPYRRLTCIAVIHAKADRLTGHLANNANNAVTLIPFPGNPKTHLSKRAIKKQLQEMRQRVRSVSVSYIRNLARQARHGSP